jgi:DNA-binding transcriptional regulator/RsmH inhibitor MraZ
MLEFCGEDRCLVDANGRIRLNQRLVSDFLRKCEGNVVMYVLPEGAVALYPEETYREMREREISDADNVGSSFAARRSLRRFGSLTQPENITRQGRITLPELLQEHAGVKAGSKVVVVGVEIGVEIWEAERFKEEMAAAEEREKFGKISPLSSRTATHKRRVFSYLLYKKTGEVNRQLGY